MLIYIEDNDDLVYEELRDTFKDNEEVKVEKKDSVDEYKNDELGNDVILLEVERSDVDYLTASITTQETISASYIQKIENVLNYYKR